MKKLMIIALVFCAITLQAGVVYTSRMTMELYSETPETQQQQEMMGDLTAPQEMKAFVEGKGARIKFLTDHMFYKKGDFMVTEDGVNLYLCDPEAKTYHRFDTKAMLGKAQGMMESVQKMTKMQYSNIAVILNKMGDGDTVAGHSTTKYKLVVEYDVNMKILFKKMKQHHREEYIIHATDDLDFSKLPQYQDQQMFKTAIEPVDAQIADKVSGIGFPLKTEHLSYDDKNNLVSKMTFEILELEEKDVNPALFKLPNGYTEKEMEVQTTDEDGNTEKKKFKIGDLF